MLETKNLKKSYKPKKGQAVDALKGVSLKFPEQGMVFLLGKSGSGKSTLLNLLGGLDQYDEGELMIKGVSSKDFSQSQFDSYRNTYVGFIFQEYNVLEEFTVGANIALAIELQGRKANDKEINEILKMVDLEGLGNRKPNELSGGQKQRVAIARALVKKPQIIMADEPTGALDSTTGKQVLDTLKKLSKEKLVIVVSHDREFAEKYADRIIELADGEVIRDVERKTSEICEEQEGITFGQDEIVFPAGYHLTEEDRKLINDYLSGTMTEVKGSVHKREQSSFQETDQSGIIHHDRVFQLIKSKLPLGNSIKIGASGLKHKKIRLIITILLSFISFSFFAMADTFSSYDNVKTCTNSIVDSKVDYVSLQRTLIQGEGIYKNENRVNSSESMVQKVSKETGLNFKGVFVPNIDLTITNTGKDSQITEDEGPTPYCTGYSGFVSYSEKELNQFGYPLIAGKLPTEGSNEVAITKYAFDTYKKAGYVDGTRKEKETQAIKEYQDMIGKKIQVEQYEFVVSGIIDTHLDIERYNVLLDDPSDDTTADKLRKYAMEQELDYIKGYSLSGALFISNSQLNEMTAYMIESIPMNDFDIQMNLNEKEVCACSITTLDEIDSSKVTWIHGEKKELNPDEIIVSSDCFEEEDDEISSMEQIVEALKKNNEVEYNYENYQDGSGSESTKKIVGVIDYENYKEAASLLIVSKDNFKEEWKRMKGTYEYFVAPMPKERSAIEKIVKYTTTNQKEKDGVMVSYAMNNSVTYELSAVDSILKYVSKGFIYVGIGFAVFAGLMLANFISTSIAYKKQEIGILRAIGARSNDVFRIFASESIIIALINFALACAATSFAVNRLNYLIRIEAGTVVTVLNFGVRQILLLLALSVGVAIVASFIPVYRTARKRPIDAIRNK